METTEIKQEELKEYLLFDITIIATKGAMNEKEKSDYEIYNKEELLERLEEIIPEEEFGFSILAATKDEDKGI
jgi:hypothetical protein